MIMENDDGVGIQKRERERETEYELLLCPLQEEILHLAAFDIEVDIFLVLPGQVSNIVKFTA